MSAEVVLITGASSGIGYEMAYIFAEKQYDLVLVARNEDAMRKLASELHHKHGITCHIYVQDLSVPGSPDRLFEKIKSDDIKVDYLVNNAGFGNYGHFIETDLTVDLELLQLNIVSLTHLSKLFVKDMVARNHGGILNVASVAAFMPGPYMNTYFASKSYVLNFSVALSHELRNTNVHVSCLCPGPTPTNFGKRAKYKSKVNGFIKTSAKKVAKEGIDGLFKNQDIVVPGKKNKAIVLIQRLLSKKAIAKIVRITAGF